MRKLIYTYSLNLWRKIKEKNSEKKKCRWEKMIKAIEENKQKVM